MAFEFKPHLMILGLIKESQMGMGRQLLSDAIRGQSDERIVKLRLNRLVHYSCLPLYEEKDIFDLLDIMLQKGLIEYKPLLSNKYAKVIGLTKRGEDELKNPALSVEPRKSYEGHYSKIEKVTDDDRKIFSSLGNFLSDLSDEQKKAAICDNKNILCIAGAGSGKTRVLTKRVWYLATLKSVDQKKILAITFTRKARQEMIERLDKLIPNNILSIETFNSFCEKILREKEEKVYGRKFDVIDFKTKVRLVMRILNDLNMNTDTVLDNYYSNKKLFSADKKTLFLGFINDLFSVLDYQRNNDISDEKLMGLLGDHPYIRDIISAIKGYKEKFGLRDYTDQIIHALEYFKKTGDIPQFEHILVDEYQDINSLQYNLINTLNPVNLFAVGDPRQSIYGWRGSRIDFILDFEINYPGAKILQLNTNYRSTKNIVKLCNSIISPMKLPELSACEIDGDNIALLKHPDEDAECLFVSQSIQSLECKKREIFILARTNKQIEKISEYLDKSGIKYIKRTIEEMKEWNPEDDQVTLSTVHAIKGLEAEAVYIIGANAKNHPCHASEHPVLEDVKINDTYDKYAEELRLMYVALSRARKKLIINYSGSLSSFFDEDTFKILNSKKKHSEEVAPRQQYKIAKSAGSLYEELKSFRLEESRRLNIPPYQVFSDRTLDELCETRPTTFEELENINGFGPFKVRKWGNKIVEIVMGNS